MPVGEGFELNPELLSVCSVLPAVVGDVSFQFPAPAIIPACCHAAPMLQDGPLDVCCGVYIYRDVTNALFCWSGSAIAPDPRKLRGLQSVRLGPAWLLPGVANRLFVLSQGLQMLPLSMLLLYPSPPYSAETSSLTSLMKLQPLFPLLWVMKEAPRVYKEPLKSGMRVCK